MQDLTGWWCFFSLTCISLSLFLRIRQLEKDVKCLKKNSQPADEKGST